MEPTAPSPSPFYASLPPEVAPATWPDYTTEERQAAAAAHRDELERIGDEIAEIAARITAATYEMLVLLADFDLRQGWDGFNSCAHWLAWRTGLALGAAREKVRVARALPELPAISAAMRRGELSYSKVRALTRVATAENEEDLLAFAHAGTAAHVERVVRAWRRLDDVDAVEGETALDRRRHLSRSLQVYTDEDGMVVVRGRLEPEAGAALVRALEAAGDALYDEGRVTDEATAELIPAAQRRADALGLVAETALGGESLGGGSLEEDSLEGDRRSRGNVSETGDGERPPEATRRFRGNVSQPADRQDERPRELPGRSRGNVSETDGANPTALDRGTRGDRYQVVVHVDAAVLADPENPGQSVLEGIGGVSAETSRRLACDGSLVAMVHDEEGRVLDVGRRTRAVSPAMRRALAHRDGGCRFPGCDSKLCDAHHIEHWAEGGETKLENLVLLCRRHHRAVHEEGYRIELTADEDEGGGIRFLRPDGRDLPRAPGVSHQALSTLEDWLVERDIEIDPAAIYPRWEGDRLDLRYALEVLRGS